MSMRSCTVRVTIFSNGSIIPTGFKFRELHVLTQVTCSYVLLAKAAREGQMGGRGSCKRSNGWAGQLQKIKWVGRAVAEGQMGGRDSCRRSNALLVGS